MAEFGFIGPGYQSRGKVGECERWVNMFIEPIESNMGAARPTRFQAFPTPGKILLCQLDDGPVTAVAASQAADNGAGSTLFFVVSGATVYAVALDTSMSPPVGTATTVGTVEKVANPFMPGQLLPCSIVVYSDVFFLVLCPTGNAFLCAFGTPILTSSLNSGGAGYAVGDTGAIAGGLISTLYIVVTVGGSGDVTSYMLIGGTGYSVGLNQQTITGGSQPGSGTGFSIDIATVDTIAWMVSELNGSALAPALGNPDDLFLQSATYLDGYTIIGLAPNSGTQEQPDLSRTFFVSNLNNPNIWNALDFGVKEASPDGLQAAFAAFEILNLFGVTTTELWQNTGNVLFPFQRLPGGGVIQVGLAGPNLIATSPQAVVWLSIDSRGQYIAYMMGGATPQRISNHAVENHWANFNITGANLYIYTENGHTFAVFNFPVSDETWVCDLELGPLGWHERGTWDGTNLHADLARYHAFTQSDFSGLALHLVGDYTTGNLYLQSLEYLNENCNGIMRIRVCPHLVDEKHWTVYPRFRLHCLTGDVPAGPAPIFNLRLSKDGGQTYGNYLPMSAGVAGAFEAIVDWYIRVRARDLVIEWSTMEAVDIVLVEGYLQGQYAGTG